MDCRQVHEELSAYIDGVLEELVALQVEAHLRACPDCAAEAEELREVIGMVRALGDIVPPEEFCSQVLARVQSEGASAQAVNTGAGWLKRFAGRGQFIAAAAIVVLGIGVSALWVKGLNPLNQFKSQAGAPEKGSTLTESADRTRITAGYNTAANGSAGTANNGVQAETAGTPAAEQKMALENSAVNAKKAVADTAGNAAGNAAGNITGSAPGLRAGRDDVSAMDTMLPNYNAAAGADRTPASRSGGTKTGSIVSTQIVAESVVKINVSDQAAAETQLDKIAAGLGGRVEKDAASLRLIVPGREFDRAVAELAKVGKIIDKQVNTRDVSGEYSDLKARIGGLEIKEKQLAEIVNQTVSPTEKISVQDELRNTQEELDLLRGQLAQLDSTVNNAVIRLELNRQG